MEYLKEIKTMEDLRAQKAKLREEVRISGERLNEDLEKLFDESRIQIKEGLLPKMASGAASFFLKEILGNQLKKIVGNLFSNGPVYAAAGIRGSNTVRFHMIRKIILFVVDLILKQRR